MMSITIATFILMGLAWPFFGFGLMSIIFHYVPEGVALLSHAVGLFLAGALSGVGMLAFQSRKLTPSWGWWIQLNYLLLAPIGILVGLLLPGPLGLEAPEVSFGLFLLVPLLIAIASNLVVTGGLAIMSGIGIGIHRIALRLQPESQSEQVRL